MRKSDVLFLAALLFNGCGSVPSKTGPLLTGIPQEARVQNEKVRAGVSALLDKKYEQANAAFNEALRLEPSNAAYHYLNALTYQLRSEQGETSLLESAETGYQVSLKLDPRVYWSATQLGHMRLEQKKYREAMEHFSHALLFEAEDPSLWHALSAAAYYSQDLPTANMAISRAETLSPTSSNIRRSATVIKAATGGKPSDGGFEGVGSDLPQVEKRVRDWELVHRRLAKAQTLSVTDGTPAAPVPSEVPASSKEMCSIDVVLIQSTESRTTNKGVNLLNGLQAQFTHSSNLQSNWSDAGTSELTKAITNTISVPAVTYNLNIFNDGSNRSEILARPTLIALNGESSEFFSGGTLKVGLQGVAGSQGTVTDLAIGVRLKVTPTFLPDGRIKLAVETSRESPELSIATSSFSQALQTAKTNVQTNVVMDFTDTLILSGLSDKQVSSVRDGVPLLKDIPVLQYFFSSEKKVEATKSVMILLTPRREQLTSKPAEETAGPNLSRLKKRHDWLNPEPNLASVMRVLDSSDYFTEFRKGDVVVEHWSTADTIGRRLRQTLDFLYY
ncbi:hypothetical protein K2X33_02120 [bacterium]|nr:hypothetical protein [bacterium]